jgi:hypothetical protein
VQGIAVTDVRLRGELLSCFHGDGAVVSDGNAD